MVLLLSLQLETIATASRDKIFDEDCKIPINASPTYTIAIISVPGASNGAMGEHFRRRRELMYTDQHHNSTGQRCR